jgi:hypothetical protein
MPSVGFPAPPEFQSGMTAMFDAQPRRHPVQTFQFWFAIVLCAGIVLAWRFEMVPFSRSETAFDPIPEFIEDEPMPPPPEGGDNEIELADWPDDEPDLLSGLPGPPILPVNRWLPRRENQACRSRMPPLPGRGSRSRPPRPQPIRTVSGSRSLPPAPARSPTIAMRTLPGKISPVRRRPAKRTGPRPNDRTPTLPRPVVMPARPIPASTWTR